MSERRGGLVRAVVVVGLILLVFLVVGLVFVGPGRDRDEPGGNGDGGGRGEVALTLLQLNDVYELTPVSGGAEGGLARVAAVRKQYLDRNPNTFTFLAGDLLNPSALSTATVDGERLAGRQMVDVMNAVGLDYATFGNHEFDLAEDAFRARLAESEFTWFSSNVSEANGEPFPGVPRNVVFDVEGEGGAEATVGLFGVTVASNPLPWVQYGDPIEAARRQVAELRGKVDILIAVTHLLVEDDVRLVQELPEIDLVLGGHEHENNSLERGADFTPILKADANARSMQVHELVYDTEDRELTHEAELRRITSDDPDDPEVAAQVDRWVQAAFEGFRSQGFEPERVVTRTTEDLDGRESTVRNQPTRLAELIANGMTRSAGSAELAMFNAGSIRIDDVIPAGDVTEYDVIRTLPFGGTVLGADMSGDLLRQVLDQGRANAGIGGYLQTANVTFTDQWLVNGAPVDPARTYRVAINDFLLSGREFRLDFLTRDRVANITEHGDIREGFIAELEATYGSP
ncbi:MAG TPA: bifunctional metallophosphatase/5'-nucleotidase [Actinomycetota bacterium]|nr:bifunctional metallophosphatase/5'-nucleotidase [Actinomycetota bacterium]